jgi:thiol-disulfide isomerase/thioredoxin
MRWMLGGLAALLGGAVMGSAGAGDIARRPGPIARGADADAAPLIGSKPAPLPKLRWLDGKSRTLESLAGKVVVIRNFTDGCPFCASTLPALEQLHRDLPAVVVLGVYHPKPPRAVTDAEARGHARELGATFPVAVDPDWSLVKSWWLERTSGPWTSVTWVLDKHGRMRFVHPGGEYHAGGGADHARCQADDQQLRAVLGRLLAE